MSDDHITVNKTDANWRALELPEQSEWSCELFGMGPKGFVFTPQKGCEPNRFWRLMQWLILGNKWVKGEKK